VYFTGLSEGFRAVDGDNATYCHTDISQPEGTPRWVRIELDAIYDVVSVIIINRPATGEFLLLIII